MDKKTIQEQIKDLMADATPAQKFLPGDFLDRRKEDPKTKKRRKMAKASKLINRRRTKAFKRRAKKQKRKGAR